MKNLSLLVIGFMAAANLFAIGGLHDSSCQPNELQAVEEIARLRLLRYHASTIGQPELFTSQGDVLDVQVCAGTIDKRTYCEKKLKNLNNQLDVQILRYKASAASQRDVDYAQEQINSLTIDCK